jgi:hypothetical protein
MGKHSIPLNMRREPNMRNPLLTTALALLAPTTLLAHGPHLDIEGVGLLENLLHLAAHAWPVLPLAVVGYFLYRSQRDKA